MLSHSCCVLLGLLSISISVVAFTSPSASHKPQPLGDLPDVSIPKPTEGPNNEELKRRQEYGPQRTLIAAPDNTCGFFNGSSGKSSRIHPAQVPNHPKAMPWGCSTGHCVFATPTTTVVTATTTNGTSLGTSLSTVVNGVASILCCDPSTGCPSAAAPTACVDKGRNDYDTLCTGSCPSDPATLKWYNFHYPPERTTKLTRMQIVLQVFTSTVIPSPSKLPPSRPISATTSPPTPFSPHRQPMPARPTTLSRLRLRSLYTRYLPLLLLSRQMVRHP